MIRDSGFVGYALIGQCMPFLLTSRASVLIFLLISGFVLLAHLMSLRISMIVSRKYLFFIELILSLLALIVIVLNFSPTWAAFLMSSALVLMLSDWVNFRILCGWFIPRKKQPLHTQPTLLENFAIVIANVRPLIFDFKDSRRYSLGCESGGFFSNMLESVISFFVHMFGLGERITRVAHIRRFRLGSNCLVTHNIAWSHFAWFADICLLTLLFCYIIGLI